MSLTGRLGNLRRWGLISLLVVLASASAGCTNANHDINDRLYLSLSAPHNKPLGDGWVFRGKQKGVCYLTKARPGKTSRIRKMSEEEFEKEYGTIKEVLRKDYQ